MPIDSIAHLLEEIGRYQILVPTQILELTKHLQVNSLDVLAVGQELVGRGWLTSYRIDKLLQGSGRKLVLGHYVVLDSLGKGGMGQVFKAKHRVMKRVVALKVIPLERLAHPGAIQRFHREVRAVARLAHPNIIHAYSADQVGNTFFFVMEYADGSDLKKLVQLRGALPVEEACEYIRQAALGLQHAFERGLVHRDIKPSNLLVTNPRLNGVKPGTVKILDMGFGPALSGQ